MGLVAEFRDDLDVGDGSDSGLIRGLVLQMVGSVSGADMGKFGSDVWAYC